GGRNTGPARRRQRGRRRRGWPPRPPARNTRGPRARRAGREPRRPPRSPRALARGMVAADHFREINRRYLLPGGDQVLIDLGKVLTASMRAVDQVGRIGGEEFMVLAPETSMDGAAALAERIRSAVEAAEFSYKGEAIRVTVSVGFAVADFGSGAEYEQLKHTAAAALSEAKSMGRNRCVIQSIS